MTNENKIIIVSIIAIILLIWHFDKKDKSSENFAPYSQILIPKIYLSDAAHDNRKSCDIARFDVSGVYNRTMFDTFNPCYPYSYWNPPRNIVYIGDSERKKMNFNYQQPSYG